jgi:hypothetical protein
MSAQAAPRDGRRAHTERGAGVADADHDEHLLLHLVLLDNALHAAVHLDVLHHLRQPTRHQPSARAHRQRRAMAAGLTLSAAPGSPMPITMSVPSSAKTSLAVVAAIGRPHRTRRPYPLAAVNLFMPTVSVGRHRPYSLAVVAAIGRPHRTRRPYPLAAVNLFMSTVSVHHLRQPPRHQPSVHTQAAPRDGGRAHTERGAGVADAVLWSR